MNRAHPPARNAAGPPAPERREVAAVAALALAHAALFATLCAIKYRWFLYDDFDLAIFAQATGGILRGSLYSSIRGMPWLGDHQSLILFLVAPLYALARSPLTLLTLQSAALAAGAFPVWRLARRALAPGAPAVMCAALYLLYPSLGYLDLFEFHPEALATPLLLVAFEGAWAGAPRRALVAAALALLAREDVALAVAGLAAAALLARRPRAGAIAGGLATLAALSLAVDFGVLRRAYGGGGKAAYLHMYAAWGDTPGAIVRGLARAPLRALAALVATPGDALDSGYKRLYWVQTLLPLAGLPLLAPLALLPAAPVVAEHLLSARLPQHAIVYQYTALVIPFVVGAAVLGLGNLARGRRGVATAAGAVALVAALTGQALFGPLASLGVLRGLERPQEILPDDEARALRPVRERMLARVPATGGVVASFEFLPRLAGRADVHALHHVTSGHYTYSTTAYPVPGGIGAVLADVGAPGLMEHLDRGTADRWHALLARNGLRPVGAQDDLLLFLAGARDTVELVTARPATPSAAPRASWAGRLALLDARARADTVAAGGVLDVAFDWARTGAVRAPLLVQLTVLDGDGDVALERLRHLGYTLAPVDRWAAGVTMRERYRLTVPPGTPPGDYALRVRAWDAGPSATPLEADAPAVRAAGGHAVALRFVVRAPRD